MKPQHVRSRSSSRGHHNKRIRRSASLSSSTSVSTISTRRSDSPRDARERLHADDTGRNKRRMSRSRSPILQHRKSSESRSHSPPQVDESSRKRVRRTPPHRRDRQRQSSDEQSNSDLAATGTHRGRFREQGRTEVEARSPPAADDVYRPNGGVQQHRTGEARRRERSLSPYSRRLALTQAMNAGR